MFISIKIVSKITHEIFESCFGMPDLVANAEIWLRVQHFKEMDSNRRKFIQRNYKFFRNWRLALQQNFSHLNPDKSFIFSN
jgi:hypothetical protein